jgi:hypothetical protein
MHLWMPMIVGFAARHHEPKRLEALPPEHLAKCIGGHQKKLRKKHVTTNITSLLQRALRFTSLPSPVAH